MICQSSAPILLTSPPKNVSAKFTNIYIASVEEGGEAFISWCGIHALLALVLQHISAQVPRTEPNLWRGPGAAGGEQQE